MKKCLSQQGRRALKRFSYPPHNTDCLSRQKSWVADFVVHDAVKYLLFIITWKRGLDRSARRGRRKSHYRIAILSSDKTRWERRWRFNGGFKQCLNSHLADKHLIYKDAQAPPVHCSGVRGVRQNLWGQKLWSPTERARSVPKTHSYKHNMKCSKGKLPERGN